MSKMQNEIIQSWKKGLKLLNQHIYLYIMSVLISIFGFSAVLLQKTFFPNFPFSIAAIIAPISLSYTFAIPRLLLSQNKMNKKVFSTIYLLFRRLIILNVLYFLLFLLVGSFYSKNQLAPQTNHTPLFIIFVALFGIIYLYTICFYSLSDTRFFQSIKYAFIFAYRNAWYSFSLIPYYVLRSFLAATIFRPTTENFLILLPINYLGLVVISSTVVYFQSHSEDIRITPSSLQEKGENKYASFTARFLAFLIDSVIIGFLEYPIGVIVLLLTIFNLAIPLFLFKSGSPDLNIISTISIILTISLYLFYPFLSWRKKHAATPGQWLMNIHIEQENSSSLPKRTAFIRVIAFYIQIVLFPLTIYYFFSKKRQMLHDVVSHTIVLKDEKPKNRLLKSVLRTALLLLFLFLVAMVVKNRPLSN